MVNFWITAIIYPVKRSLPLPWLWTLLLPLTILALVTILDRTRPFRQFSSTGNFWEQLGTQAFTSGDNQRSIPLLSMAAAAHSLTTQGWILLGDAYQANGDPTSALLAWKNAGNSVAVLERRLQAHRLLHAYPSAIADLQTLLSFQPEDASRLYQLGLLLAATQPDQAASYLNRAAALSPSYSKPVLELTRRIQAAQPTSQPAYTLLESGRALADLNQWELAAEAFRVATSLRPDYSEAWAFLGEALQHINLPEGKTYSSAGLVELEFARQLDPTSLSANLFLALYRRRQGEWASALEILDKIAALYPQNPVIQIEMGNTLAEKGDAKTALTHYVRATQLSPSEPDCWLALAGFSVHIQYQVRQVALPAARQLLLLTPTDPAALDLMGQALFLLEDPFNAERFFQRAIQSDASYAPARLHLAQVYLLRGATVAAHQELELTINLAPSSSEAEFARRLLQSTSP